MPADVVPQRHAVPSLTTPTPKALGRRDVVLRWCGGGADARSCSRACYSKCSIASPACCPRGVSVKPEASSGGAAPYLAPLHGPSRRSLHPLPLNDTNYDHHNREDQEDVNESAHCGRGDKTQRPEDNQYDYNGLEFFSYPSELVLVGFKV